MSTLAMRILTVVGVLMSLVWWGVAPVRASEADSYWMCKTTTPVGWCPTSSTNPIPTTSAQFPATLGQKTMAASLPVVLASDQSTVPVGLAAGAALVGKVGIDQTTPGVTNAVVLTTTYAQITISTIGTTAATTATLAGVSAKTTFICGFAISSDATAALAGNATVTGTVSGTLNFIQNVGTATSAGVLTQTFNPCIPASAANTGIVVNSIAAGVGGNTDVTAWGYQQ